MNQKQYDENWLVISKTLGEMGIPLATGRHQTALFYVISNNLGNSNFARQLDFPDETYKFWRPFLEEIESTTSFSHLYNIHIIFKVISDVGPQPRISDYIKLYATSIAENQKSPITNDIVKTAYEFFLYDLAIYFQNGGVSFEENESIIGWYVLSVAFSIDAVVFLIATNKRIFTASNGKIISEIKLGTSENYVKFLGYREVSPLEKLLILSTNKRCLLHLSGKFLEMQLEENEDAENVYYSKNTKTVLFITSENIIEWTLGKDPIRIKLDNITSSGTREIVNDKKFLFIPYQTKELKIKIHAPKEITLNFTINQTDVQDQGTFFLKELKKKLRSKRKANKQE